MFLMSTPDNSGASETRADQSFRQLVETHQRSVYWLARDLTGNHHDAEDLSQEVFLKAYRGLSGFRGDARVDTWLRRIAVNTYLNRRRKKALRFMQLFGDADEPDASPSAEPAPDVSADGSIVKAHIERAMQVLSDRERTAFILRHWHEMSVREVAAAMDVAEGTIKSLLFRAGKKLRSELAFLREASESPEIETTTSISP